MDDGTRMLVSTRKLFCKDQIIILLKKNKGTMSRYELRMQLIELGYGSEGIRQALLMLVARGVVEATGSSKSPKKQIITLV